MKNIIFILFLLLICGTFSFAQCNKKVTLLSSTTEYLNGNNELQRSETEKTTIKIDKSALTISPGNEEHVMDGTIKSDSCHWKVPYKEGKTIIKALLTDKSGDTKNATITIEGKGGKVTLVMEVQEMPDRKIRVPIDTFEETK